MQGPSQHHIPQMLQRGFHVPGAKNQTWEFRSDAPAERKAIRLVGERKHFYSEPSFDGEPTLDGDITKYESTKFGALLTRLKRQAAGTAVAPGDAAEAVAHLTMRAAYIRNVFARGIRQFADGARDVFSDANLVKRLVGLDSSAPAERFHEGIGKSLAENPQVQEAGIPLPLVESMAFTFAKENFETFFAEQRPQIDGLLGLLSGLSEKTARDGHNSALQRDFRGAQRAAQLQTFQWFVEAAPSEGLILPDSVALGFQTGEPPTPYLACDSERLVAVALPLSSSKLLFGCRKGEGRPPLDDINRDLAACSHEYFIAAVDRIEFADLTRLIGGRSSTVIEDAVREALGEYTRELATGNPSSVPSNEPSNVEDADEPADLPAPQDLNYQITLSGRWNQEALDRIMAAIRATVSQLSQILPLQRLDGITVAADYPAALRELDRGIPGAAPLTTVGEDVGIGIAMSPIVLRGGIIKCRVIIVAGLADALVSDDQEHHRWALHILANQLAQVAFVEIVDSTLPNAILQPIADPLDRLLFESVSSALDGYVTARVSAFLAPENLVPAYRDLFVSALDRAHEAIPRERLDYRFHGDMDQLLAVAFPAVGHVLNFGAHLVGLCDGLDVSPFDDEGTLAAALEKCGLRAWLAVFQTDLKSFFNRIGGWESFDEFLSFNKHVERIVWQFGLVPWRNEEGSIYVKVPFGPDAAAL